MLPRKFLTYFDVHFNVAVIIKQFIWVTTFMGTFVHLPGEDLSAHSPSQQDSDGQAVRRVRRLECDDTHQI